MLDIGLSELMVFAVIALVVLGPDKLPVALKTAARYYVKIKKFVGNIQRDIEKELNITELKQMMQEEMHRIEALEHHMQQKFAELERQQREFAAQHEFKQKPHASPDSSDSPDSTGQFIKTDPNHQTVAKTPERDGALSVEPRLKPIGAIAPIDADADKPVQSSIDTASDVSSNTLHTVSQDLAVDGVTADDAQQLYIYSPAYHRIPFLTRHELRLAHYSPLRCHNPYYQVAV